MAPSLDTDVVYGVPDDSLDDVVRLLQSTGWAADRDRAGIRRMLDNTDVVVCLVRGVASGRVQDHEVVAFGRALTDYEYRAFIEDVVVSVPYRNRGLGAKLVESLCSHPALAGVERIALECRADLVDFYRPFDFEQPPSQATLMIREQRDAPEGHARR